MEKIFSALVVREQEAGKFTRSLEQVKMEDLPDGEVLIKVHYSSLNYKDGLSAVGNKGVTRNYPHTPGIDAAGTVAYSSVPEFSKGEEVIVTGFDLGMNTNGGYGEYIRVPSAWVIPLPKGLTLKESMIFGTAGLTAGLCTEALIAHGITPSKGPVLVSGGSGGVGSLSVAILSKLGYEVIAVTGKKKAHEILKSLGVGKIISREEAVDSSGKPLLRPIYAGAIDTVGGSILTTAMKSLKYGGSIACCGLVSSPKIDLTVFPFILKGNNLLGIDSVECEIQKRIDVWNKLAGPWKPDQLSKITETCNLDQLSDKIQQILKGELMGRTVVSLY
ncbi:YhdH/YhfP family quinone oxidoreductase [Limibacter armeniacum]|uniref:YhdH/YhfP family quinone oxidoreductase n=1 Tax=Limibacter armeniacum TaxID=466084 RepID=UPI002FE5AD9B